MTFKTWPGALGRVRIDSPGVGNSSVLNIYKEQGGCLVGFPGTGVRGAVVSVSSWVEGCSLLWPFVSTSREACGAWGEV